MIIELNRFTVKKNRIWWGFHVFCIEFSSFMLVIWWKQGKGITFEKGVWYK